MGRFTHVQVKKQLTQSNSLRQRRQFDSRPFARLTKVKKIYRSRPRYCIIESVRSKDYENVSIINKEQIN